MTSANRAAAEPSRRKAFVLGSISGYLARGVSILVALVSIPIAIDYFGPVVYGLWMVAVSIVAYFELSQFGLGTATTTLIAKSADERERRGVLHHSVTLLVLFAAGVAAIGLTGGALWPGWRDIFGDVSPTLQRQAGEAAAVLVLLFLLRLPGKAVTAAFSGLQKVYWERFYETATTLAGLGALVVVIVSGSDLPALALLTGGTACLIAGIAAIHLLGAHPELRFHPFRPAPPPPRRHVLVSGGRFFAIGIAAMIVWATDNLVISYFLGPERVTAYSVTFRLFATGFAFFTILNGVVAPIYGRAAGQGQWEWVDRTYATLTTVLPVLAGALWIGGVGFAEDIIRLWTGPAGYGGGLVVLALGAYGYCLALVHSHASLLTALNATRRMMGIGWAEALVNLTLSLLLVGPLGLFGVALGTLLGSLLTGVWLLPLDVAHQTGGKVRFRVRHLLLHTGVATLPCLLGMALLDAYGPGGAPGLAAKAAALAIYLGASWSFLPADARKAIVHVLGGRKAG